MNLYENIDIIMLGGKKMTPLEITKKKAKVSQFLKDAIEEREKTAKQKTNAETIKKTCNEKLQKIEEHLKVVALTVEKKSAVNKIITEAKQKYDLVSKKVIGVNGAANKAREHTAQVNKEATKFNSNKFTDSEQIMTASEKARSATNYTFIEARLAETNLSEIAKLTLEFDKLIKQAEELIKTYASSNEAAKLKPSHIVSGPPLTHTTVTQHEKPESKAEHAKDYDLLVVYDATTNRDSNIRPYKVNNVLGKNIASYIPSAYFKELKEHNAPINVAPNYTMHDGDIILSESPKPTKFSDFRDIVQHCNIDIIIMLAYENAEYDDYSETNFMTSISREHENEHEPKHIVVTDMMIGGKTVKHIWFRKWKEHNIPTDIDFNELLKTYYYVKQEIMNDLKHYLGVRTLIHCSSGSHRSGILAACLLCKTHHHDKINEEKIKKIIAILGWFRKGSADDQGQQTFLLTYLIDYKEPEKLMLNSTLSNNILRQKLELHDSGTFFTELIRECIGKKGFSVILYNLVFKYNFMSMIKYKGYHCDEKKREFTTDSSKYKILNLDGTITEFTFDEYERIARKYNEYLKYIKKIYELEFDTTKLGSELSKKHIYVLELNKPKIRIEINFRSRIITKIDRDGNRSIYGFLIFPDTIISNVETQEEIEESIEKLPKLLLSLLPDKKKEQPIEKLHLRPHHLLEQQAKIKQELEKQKLEEQKIKEETLKDPNLEALKQLQISSSTTPQTLEEQIGIINSKFSVESLESHSKYGHIESQIRFYYNGFNKSRKYYFISNPLIKFTKDCVDSNRREFQTELDKLKLHFCNGSKLIWSDVTLTNNFDPDDTAYSKASDIKLSDFKNKYLKYKEKYLQLKKLFY